MFVRCPATTIENTRIQFTKSAMPIRVASSITRRRREASVSSPWIAASAMPSNEEVDATAPSGDLKDPFRDRSRNCSRCRRERPQSWRGKPTARVVMNCSGSARCPQPGSAITRMPMGSEARGRPAIQRRRTRPARSAAERGEAAGPRCPPEQHEPGKSAGDEAGESQGRRLRDGSRHLIPDAEDQIEGGREQQWTVSTAQVLNVRPVSVQEALAGQQMSAPATSKPKTAIRRKGSRADIGGSGRGRVRRVVGRSCYVHAPHSLVYSTDCATNVRRITPRPAVSAHRDVSLRPATLLKLSLYTDA